MLVEAAWPTRTTSCSPRQTWGADDVERDGSVFPGLVRARGLGGSEVIEAAVIRAQGPAELMMVPKTTVAVAEESAAKKLIRLIDMLEESDDVQEVSANFDILYGSAGGRRLS